MPPILFPGMRAPPARMPATVTMKMVPPNSPGVALLGQEMIVGDLKLELLGPLTSTMWRSLNLRHSWSRRQGQKRGERPPKVCNADTLSWAPLLRILSLD